MVTFPLPPGTTLLRHFGPTGGERGSQNPSKMMPNPSPKSALEHSAHKKCKHRFVPIFTILGACWPDPKTHNFLPGGRNFVQKWASAAFSEPELILHLNSNSLWPKGVENGAQNGGEIQGEFHTEFEFKCACHEHHYGCFGG